MDTNNIIKTINHLVELYIPIGLPGSGKTYFGSQLEKKYPDNISIIDFDEIMGSDKSSLEKVSYVSSIIKKYVFHTDKNNNHTIIYADGLFLDELTIMYAFEQLIDSINAVEKLSYSGIHKYTVCKVVFVHWPEDRETCLLNDKGRRKQSAAGTIANADYMSIMTPEFVEKANQYIKEKGYSALVKVKAFNMIYKATNFEKVVSDAGKYFENGKFVSDWWVVGKYCDNVPVIFKIFVDTIEAHCPDIKVRQYEELKERICRIETTIEQGYYDEETIYSRWTCDAEELKNELIEIGANFNE